MCIKKYLGQYFVAAISTDIGKTHFVTKYCRKIEHSFAIKPIISGFKKEDHESDSAKILNALGLEINQHNLDLISPWRFELAASPHIAANDEINFTELVDFCHNNIKKAQKAGKTLFIESAGGIMTPINKDKTFIDLAQKLQIPVILITANFLGSISQTLCCIESLKSRNITIETIIVNNPPQLKINDSKISDKDFLKYITNYK
mgnify:CR=1 FL=1